MSAPLNRRQLNIGHELAGMEHGERRRYEGYGKSYEVSYHHRQSYADAGFPVPGAMTGEYTVTHPDGRTTEHPHGPHALTDEARRMGANPGAKSWAAEQAGNVIQRGLMDAKMTQMMPGR